MSEQDNIRIVQDGFSDFLSGNIPGLIGRFADEFEFTVPGAPEVPYAGTSATPPSWPASSAASTRP